jgi:NAD(P)-dependent dehydrogenase (short-subunit alcohol dehydrogenase family)
MNLNEISKLYDFTGRSVVVTGGTGVLGKSIVEALVGCGANAAVIGRSVDKGQALIDSLKGAGRAIAIQCDVLKADQLEAARQTVLENFGRVDCLVNGAGGNRPEATTSDKLSFFDLPEETMRQVFDLNLLGTVLPSQIFGRQMAQQGAGAILNISSISSLRPLTRVVGYSAAKAAINNFTAWLAVHLAKEYSPQIRVNAIAPGFFLTEQNRFLLTDENTGQLTARGQSIIDHTPMARFGEPADLISAVLWLLSPASSFVTGVVIPVDGGFQAFSGV